MEVNVKKIWNKSGICETLGECPLWHSVVVGHVPIQQDATVAFYAIWRYVNVWKSTMAVHLAERLSWCHPLKSIYNKCHSKIGNGCESKGIRFVQQ